MRYDRNWLTTRMRMQSRWLPLGLIAVVLGMFIGYCFLAPPGVNPDFAASPLTVPILLVSKPFSEEIRFSIHGPYKIYCHDRNVPYTSPGYLYGGVRLKRASVGYDDSKGLQINRQPVRGPSMVVVPEESGLLEVNGRFYGGSFKFEIAKDGKLRLINLVDLEEYLAGVIFKEMPASFQDEALKAQIIAARTYTLQRLASGSDYLTDDTRSQVYGGISAVTVQARTLVEETRGLVLTYDDALLPAYYSSTCGGTSARASDAFSGEAPPPLEQCHACGYCSISPYYRWSVKVSADEIRTRFKLPSTLRAFRIAATAWDPLRRCTEITIFNDRQEKVLHQSAESFRRTVNQGKPLKERVLSTCIENISVKGNQFVFEGKGWGHGVGLCQYGAQGMALKGMTFRKILAYYYPDAEIVSGYGAPTL